jgi:Fur family ferric uptake transcriptional regulator
VAAKVQGPNPSLGLRGSLHERGQRLTPQRQKVLALFEQLGEGRHLSAEDVHQRLRRGDGRVSLATVYRTLRLLSSLGLLQELELPEGGRRFELASDAHPDHHHLVCVRCGRTEEFESGAVLVAGEQAALAQGFLLLECVLNVRCLCPGCAAEGEPTAEGEPSDGGVPTDGGEESDSLRC